MYRNISRQAYRNLNEYRLSHKVTLEVGMVVALLKSRTDNETNQTVYSLTTNCKIISINATRILGTTNITLKPEDQDPLYLDYCGFHPTISRSDKYTFTTIVLSIPPDVDLSRVLNGKLYYILVNNFIYLNGIKKCSRIEVPVFGYDVDDAFNQLVANTETELSLGDKSYRLVDMDDISQALRLSHKN